MPTSVPSLFQFADDLSPNPPHVGLDYSYYGGNLISSVGIINIPEGVVSLPANSTCFVECSDVGVVSYNLVGPTAGFAYMAKVITGVSTIRTTVDERALSNVSDPFIPGGSTGTTSDYFQMNVNHAGFKWRDVLGEAQIRNAADTDFGDLRVRNLIVEGVESVLNSVVQLDVNPFMELNAGIGGPIGNVDGGLILRRMAALVSGVGTITVTAGSVNVVGVGTSFSSADIGKGLKTAGGQFARIVEYTDAAHVAVNEAFVTTEAGVSYQEASPDNVSLAFNISTSRFQAGYGAVGSTQPKLDMVLKKSVDNDAAATTTVTHNFNTKDVTVACYDKATNVKVEPGITTTLNTVVVDFGVVQLAGAFRIIVEG